MKTPTARSNGKSLAPAGSYAEAMRHLRHLRDEVRPPVWAACKIEDDLGEHRVPEMVKKGRDLEREALALSNGAAIEIPKKRSHADLKYELEIIDRAISIVSQVAEERRLNEAAALVEQRRPEISEHHRQIAMSLIAIEANFAALDRIAEDVLARSFIPGFEIRLAGRLRNTGSPLHAFLEWATTQGFLDRKTFASAVEQARQHETVLRA
jgi:hypothetical protein